jgi:hypothetical protein
MPLDEAWQALLDVFCHCYAGLLDHLDALDDASRFHPEWSVYRVVKECFNPATKAFGSELPGTLDLASLCSDFLKRVEGFVAGRLGPSSPVVQTCSAYRQAVEASPVSAQCDLRIWQDFGEGLSRACYQTALEPESVNLSRVTKPLRIEPSSKQSFHCLALKDGGHSEITFYFAPPEFVFQSYVNLPLYCFHEYFSHVHTAPLLAESDPCPKPFEEGWLLHVLHDFFEHHLIQEPHPALNHHSHRAHYAHQYIQEQNDDENQDPWVPFGYEQARKFMRVVGPDLLKRTSLLVAATPHNRFPDMIRGVQSEFVYRVQRWLEQVATKSPEEKEHLLERLDALLQSPDPLPRLLEFLIEH